MTGLEPLFVASLSAPTSDADRIRALVAAGPIVMDDNQVECPVCNKQMHKGGFGPHRASHLRAIGDLPPQVQPKRKPRKPKAVPAEQPPREPTISAAPVSTRDVCLGVLFGLLGPNASIPMGELDEVLGWIDFTEAMIERLR